MSRNLFLKILERFLWTFVQGATATLLLANFLDTEAWKAAAVGGVASVLSLIKSYAGTKMGDPSSPAWLPASVTAAGGVVGEVTGQVVSQTGEVLGEVTGVVDGVLGEER